MPKYCETSDGSSQALQGPSAFTNRASSWRKRQKLSPPKKGRPRKHRPETSVEQESGNGCAQGAPDDEGSHQGARKKRPKSGGDDPSDHGRGTAAQQAAAQLGNKSGKKPQRGAQSQTSPDSASIVVDQPSRIGHPYYNLEGMTQLEPLGESGLGSPTAVDDPGSRQDQDPGEMTELEGSYETQFLTPQDTIDPRLITYDPANHELYPQQPISSSMLPTSTLTPGPSNQGHLDSPQSGEDPDSSQELPESEQAFSMQWSDDETMQPSEQFPTQYPPVPDPANTEDKWPSNQAPASNVTSGEPPVPSSSDFGSNLSTQDHSTQGQVAQPFDFRDYEPRSDADIDEIQGALNRTINSFNEAHPNEIAPKTAWYTYNESFVILEGRHWELCEFYGSLVSPLAGLGPWYHALNHWRHAKET